MPVFHSKRLAQHKTLSRRTLAYPPDLVGQCGELMVEPVRHKLDLWISVQEVQKLRGQKCGPGKDELLREGCRVEAVDVS